MKRALLAFAAFCLVSTLAVNAHADLDGFLSKLNLQAKTNLHDFSLKLSAQFNLPLTKVQAVIRTVDEPADAYMCLEIGEMTHQPPEVVISNYRSNKGKGWGKIAQDLGIKPGSAEFHALKNGDLHFTGTPKPDAGKDKGGAKGQEKKGADQGNPRSKGHKN